MQSILIYVDFNFKQNTNKSLILYFILSQKITTLHLDVAYYFNLIVHSSSGQQLSRNTLLARSPSPFSLLALHRSPSSLSIIYSSCSFMYACITLFSYTSTWMIDNCKVTTLMEKYGHNIPPTRIACLSSLARTPSLLTLHNRSPCSFSIIYSSCSLVYACITLFFYLYLDD